MRFPQQLPREALLEIVETIQQLLYFDTDSQGETVIDPDKFWSGADVCQELGLLLAKHDLVPHEKVRFTDPA